MKSSDVALILSLCALFFTIFSFWYMNWRSGKLNVGPINTLYIGTGIEGFTSKVHILGVPLIIWNSGAQPLVLHKLRVEMNELGLLWEFERTQTSLDLNYVDSKDDYLALPLSLKANEIKTINAIFNLRLNGFEYTSRNYKFKIQALLFGKAEWITVSEIKFDCSNSRSSTLYDLNADCKLYKITS
ncbi:hypothetical protein GBN32_12005 [Plesiomonas shigelloides]|uniref:hypothetical protein n=1 Tax=Plesiomonas shigelloides TaxID=703 RepID=UPI001261A664|nr:hypothetical protein [Plesiomonas shigelloides]KAB7709828.1 hypothetical protein GBN32_12005 [Plesiomonas shigelloides]